MWLGVSGGSRFYTDLPRLFWGTKLVYLVADPAGVFLYLIDIHDLGWRTGTISDT